jgi:hypothetical protein
VEDSPAQDLELAREKLGYEEPAERANCLSMLRHRGWVLGELTNVRDIAVGKAPMALSSPTSRSRRLLPLVPLLPPTGLLLR